MIRWLTHTLRTLPIAIAALALPACSASVKPAAAPSATRTVAPVKTPASSHPAQPPADYGHPLLPSRSNPRGNGDPANGIVILDICKTVTFHVVRSKIEVDVNLPGEMDLMVDPEKRNGDPAYDGSVVADYTMPQGARHHVIVMPYEGPIDHVGVQALRHHTDLDMCWAYRS